MKDVDGVDFFNACDADRHDRLSPNLDSDDFAPSLGYCFGVTKPRDWLRRVEDHCRRHDGAGDWTAARFIDAGDGRRARVLELTVE